MKPNGQKCRETDCSTIMLGDFNTLLLITDLQKWPEDKKGNRHLTNTINQLDLRTELDYRTLYPKTIEDTFSCTQGDIL